MQHSVKDNCNQANNSNLQATASLTEINEILKVFFSLQPAKAFHDELWIMFRSLVGTETFNLMENNERSNMAYNHEVITKLIFDLENFHKQSRAKIIS